jgi:hypothetical protein
MEMRRIALAFIVVSFLSRGNFRKCRVGWVTDSSEFKRGIKEIREIREYG